MESPIVKCKSILILGGARSGKSKFAEKLVLESSKSPVYLATAQPLDKEMESRIDSHKKRRNSKWQTIEESIGIVDVMAKHSTSENIILVDCLTLWLSNLMQEDSNIGDVSARLISIIPQLPGKVVFVSNEVGMGIVPDNRISRSFRDQSGNLNKKMAEICDVVYFIAASQPILLKPNLQPEIKL